MVFKCFENAVVVENLKIVGRVEESHEVVERLFSGIFVTFFNKFLTAELTNIVSGLCTVMTISDIKIGYVAKSGFKEVSIFLRGAPQHMAYAIVGHHITVALLLSNLIDTFTDSFLVVTESKENGANVSVLDISELCAILFLFGKSELMALNCLLLVVLNRSETHDSSLGVTFHSLLVDVEGGLGVLLQVSLLNEVLQVFTAF